MDEFSAALEAEASGAGFTLDAAPAHAAVGSGFGAAPAMLRAIETHPRPRPAHCGADEQLGVRPSTVARRERLHDALAFDVVVESSVEGLRKPDPRIYELVLDRLGVRAEESVFLDDLGINLKPARAMGMTTIKVTDPDAALASSSRCSGSTLE